MESLWRMDYEFQGELVPDFEFVVDHSGDACRVTCSGILDIRDASAVMQPELFRFHEAVLASKLGVVHVDVRQIEYMNSNGIKAFLAWFLKADISRKQRYRVELVYDETRNWQEVSFTTMARLAQKVLRLKPLPQA